jgi:hypothetical protein
MTAAARAARVRASRLLAQRLIGPKAASASAAIAGLVAIQAQDYPGAKWGVATRVAGLTDAEIERDFASGAILRTHVLRPTWHFVLPSDIRWLLQLTGPRVHALNAPVARRCGIDARTLSKAMRTFERALDHGAFRTRDELRDALSKAGVDPGDTLRMAYIVMHAELEGLVCSGPRRGKQFTYAWLEDRVPRAPARSRDEALAELSARYFTSRGPATVHDFAKWSGLTIAMARDGLDSVRRSLVDETVDGRTYWFSADRPAGEKAPAEGTAHLLCVYDEYISGYKDRSAMGSPSTGRMLEALGNALHSVVAVDGRIVGVWNRRVEEDRVAVSIELFERIPRGRDRALAAAARAYGAFLGMPSRLETRAKAALATT